ncbi:integrase [Aquabacterium sp. NJ1]|uniref:hypothetical protein n=1 Tax=Aquabacterium sp. NJ1 TaxID=1538295 RepID=UPI00052CA9C6|nr:hypothetical protein [Aquabacterium sp. NJ1]KGM41015.1 integrase [Aquabacterium sp. NJ1]
MSDLIEELKAKLLHSTELIQQIASERNRRTGRSPNTEHDYLRLGQTLLTRAKTVDGGLIGAVSDTRRPTTFQKRIAALRFTLQSRQLELLDSIVEPVTAELAQKWLRLLDEQIDHIQSVIELRRQGLVGQRLRRRSKRVALGGLPPDWREQLCQRGSTGRYADALLLAALTGCRPSELERGIQVSRAVNAETEQSLIQIVINGVKVKISQGQPIRRLRYAEDDDHPLVLMLKEALSQSQQTPMFVQIDHAGNFSVEVRRLAASLWPEYQHPITAYCLRHQWAADAKRVGDTGAVSRGLGHLSAKTQKLYGTASQGRRGHVLRPVSVDAERPVKDAAAPAVTSEPDEPEPAS